MAQNFYEQINLKSAKLETEKSKIEWEIEKLKEFNMIIICRTLATDITNIAQIYHNNEKQYLLQYKKPLSFNIGAINNYTNGDFMLSQSIGIKLFIYHSSII